VRGPTCSTPPPGRYCCSACLAIPRRPTPTCRWPATRRRKALQADPGPGGRRRRPGPGAGGCARFLGQQPPSGLADAGLAAVWAWARQRWSMARVPRWRAVPAPRYG
jgi:hypothetical protein